jgi:AsmA protein
LNAVAPTRTSWLRKLLPALGALLLVAVAAGIWLVATFDANQYKGVAIDWMKAKRDRTLVIDGPIKLSVFPRLEVELTDVSLSEKGRPDMFVSLKQAALAVDVLPLLRKQLVVDRIAAKGVRVSYLRDKAGKGNLDDLTADEPTEPAAPKTDTTPLKFDVSAIQLDDVVVKVKDDLGRLDGTITLQSLSTGRLADGIESPVKLNAQLAMRSPELNGQLQGGTKLTLNLASKALRLQDMQLAWTGDAVGVKALTANLKGGIAYGGGMVQADDLNLAFGGSLGDTTLAGSRVAVKVFTFDPAKKNMALTQLQVKLAGKQGENPLSLALDWPELTVNPTSLSGSALTGRMTLEGPNAVDAKFKSGAPRGSFERITVPQFETTLKGKSGPRQMAGTLRADLQIDPGAKALAVDALVGNIKLQEPSLQPLDIDLRGHAQASADAAKWTLQGQINTNPFTTEGTAALAKKPMQLKVDARFAALDLNRLLPAGKAASSAAPAPATKAEQSAPIDLSALRSVDGQFAVRVGQFAYQKYRIADFVLDATLNDGLLRVGKLAGKSWGGTLDANASVNARDNRVAIKAVASGVNVNALMKDVVDKDILEGTGRVTADLNTHGRSVAEMKSLLAGTAALQLRDGAIKGVNLARSLRQAKAALTMQQDTVQQARQTEKTDFSEMSASFVITNGVARSNDLDMKSPFLRLGGDGVADIGQGRIDYTARATVAGTSKGQDGADLAALKGLTVPVRLTGPFEAIAWNIQWSAIAAAALKSQVLDKATDKLKDKLAERLNGKLGAPAPAANGASAPAASPRDQLKDRLKGLLK